MLLIALWVPITSHCYLEQAGIIPFDECCASDAAAPTQTDPCDSGCKVVEKAGNYKTQNEQKISAPAILVTYCVETLLLPKVDLPPRGRIVSWPPDTLSLAQFVACTALPVRAPSFVS